MGGHLVGIFTLNVTRDGLQMASSLSGNGVFDVISVVGDYAVCYFTLPHKKSWTSGTYCFTFSAKLCSNSTVLFIKSSLKSTVFFCNPGPLKGFLPQFLLILLIQAVGGAHILVQKSEIAALPWASSVGCKLDDIGSCFTRSTHSWVKNPTEYE